jgi:hypothetical protein
MGAEHFDTVVRTFDPRSRRHLLGLGAFSGVAVTFGPLTFFAEAKRAITTGRGASGPRVHRTPAWSVQRVSMV